jgi:hypothetical protein
VKNIDEAIPQPVIGDELDGPVKISISGCQKVLLLTEIGGEEPSHRSLELRKETSAVDHVRGKAQQAWRNSKTGRIVPRHGEWNVTSAGIVELVADKASFNQ